MVVVVVVVKLVLQVQQPLAALVIPQILHHLKEIMAAMVLVLHTAEAAVEALLLLVLLPIQVQVQEMAVLVLHHLFQALL